MTMASRATTGGGQLLPFALIGQAIPKLSRHDLEALTERLIDALDSMDGDLDLEPNGDELDGSNAEDDYRGTANMGIYSHAGCPISDPDQAVDDKGCDDLYNDREPDDYGDSFADPIAYGEQLRRLQRTRCIPQFGRNPWNGTVHINSHRLFSEPEAPTKRQLFRRKRGVPRRPRA